MSTCKIDNAEAPHSEPDVALHHHTLIVRAAMHDRVTHSSNFRRFDSAVACNPRYACNAAHGSFSKGTAIEYFR